MIDAFVLLTPILVLAILALFAFIGCDAVLHFEPVHVPSPTVTTVTPSFGPSAGGTPVKIFGSNLSGVDSVTFGGADATNISVVSDSEVDVTTPPHAPGQVDVVVTNTPNSTSGTGSGLYTYNAIGFVQTQSAALPGNPPISVTLNNTSQGNLLLAAVSYGGPATGSVDVKDNLGTAFTLFGKGPWFRQSRFFYLPDIPGGTVTIQAAPVAGATGPCAICVSEYSGADTSSPPIYGFSTNFSPAAGTAGLEVIKGIALTPAQPGDIGYIVVFASQNTTLVPGQGLTPHPSAVTSVLVEDTAAAVTAAQTVATDDTTGGSFVPWVVLAVVIKA